MIVSKQLFVLNGLQQQTIKEITRSSALNSKIKTEFTTLYGKEVDGVLPSGTVMKPLRLSENGIVGTVEKIESQVKLPDSRIPGTPETGSESCSGSLNCEWNIDEQDDLIASAMCSEWTDCELTETETENGVTEKKELIFGEKRDVYQILKKYNQAPVEYQLFKGCQVNEMSLTLALNSFAQLVFIAYKI